MTKKQFLVGLGAMLLLPTFAALGMIPNIMAWTMALPSIVLATGVLFETLEKMAIARFCMRMSAVFSALLLLQGLFPGIGYVDFGSEHHEGINPVLGVCVVMVETFFLGMAVPIIYWIWSERHRVSAKQTKSS